MLVNAPTREFLTWVARCPRTYVETIEAWGSHCPRFTIWEDVQLAGLVVIKGDRVVLTALGCDALKDQLAAGYRTVQHDVDQERTVLASHRLIEHRG